MPKLTTQDLEAIRKRAERAAVDGPGSSADTYMQYHARRDIPALLAEVEHYSGKISFYLDEIERIRAVVVDKDVEIAKRDVEVKQLTEKYEDMTSIALWATRRLRHSQHKDFAYDAIERNLGREVERI